MNKYAISIHALRAEGDALYDVLIRRRKISIHALRAEGDVQYLVDYATDYKFLSTPSVRRATPEPVICSLKSGYFYPRPPCGGRPSRIPPCRFLVEFLSTPPVRRATRGRI